jgi:hypothetical protein
MRSNAPPLNVAEQAGNLLGSFIYRRPTSEDSAGGFPQAAHQCNKS